jgi:hypothetical protein
MLLTRYQWMEWAFKWRGVPDEPLHELMGSQESVRDGYRGVFSGLSQRIPAKLMRIFQKLDELQSRDARGRRVQAEDLHARRHIKTRCVSQTWSSSWGGIVALQKPSAEIIDKLDGNTMRSSARRRSSTRPKVTSVIACTYLKAFKLGKDVGGIRLGGEYPSREFEHPSLHSASKLTHSERQSL